MAAFTVTYCSPMVQFSLCREWKYIWCIFWCISVYSSGCEAVFTDSSFKTFSAAEALLSFKIFSSVFIHISALCTNGFSYSLWQNDLKRKFNVRPNLKTSLTSFNVLFWRIPLCCKSGWYSEDNLLNAEQYLQVAVWEIKPKMIL